MAGSHSIGRYSKERCKSATALRDFRSIFKYHHPIQILLIMNTPVTEEGEPEKGVILRPSVNDGLQNVYRKIEIYSDTMITEDELVRHHDETLRDKESGEYAKWLCEAALQGRHGTLRSSKRIQGAVPDIRDLLKAAKKARFVSRQDGEVEDKVLREVANAGNESSTALPEGLSRAMTKVRPKAKAPAKLGAKPSKFSKSAAKSSGKGTKGTQSVATGNRRSDDGVMVSSVLVKEIKPVLFRHKRCLLNTS